MSGTTAQFEGGCHLRRSPLYRDRTAQGGMFVSLSELSKAYRCTGRGLRAL
jgi:hypothetical protein